MNSKGSSHVTEGMKRMARERIWIAHGHQSRTEAQDMMETMIEYGETCEEQNPEIKSYVAGNNKVRYGVTAIGTPSVSETEVPA